MNVPLRSRLASKLLVVVLAMVAGTWAGGQVLGHREQAGHDSREVARLSDKMKSVCVGRFLIDLPQDTEVELTRARIDGIELAAFHETSEEFQKRLADREAEIDLYSENRSPEWIDDLPRLVTKVVANPENQVPAEPGFCLDHAYVRDPLTAEQGEAIMMSARLPTHPDVYFSLILAAGIRPDEQGLLERARAAPSLQSFTGIVRTKEWRAAPREIRGLVGNGLVESFAENGNLTVPSFWWEVNGTEDDVFIPHIAFRMETGEGAHKPVPSSLSSGAATAFWDKVTSTFRPLAKPPRTAGGPAKPMATGARRAESAAGKAL